MKHLLVLVFIALTTHNVFCQTENGNEKKNNSIYFYWGWNRASFSKSTMNFSGADYDFTLKNAVAKDRQSKFSLDPYFHPGKFTIPQYNFRVGYFFKEKWDISFGIDHMKYVLEKNQVVEISGHIGESSPEYNGLYDNAKITITEDFLKFEHSDGLNYPNFELRHSNNIIDLDKFKISLIEGFGAGICIPRTNTSLLGRERYDEFHLSGYGVNAVLGLNMTFFKHFFVQSEWRAGFIDLPEVRTTPSEADRASHNFFFSQVNIVFGGRINI